MVDQPEELDDWMLEQVAAEIIGIDAKVLANLSPYAIRRQVLHAILRMRVDRSDRPDGDGLLTRAVNCSLYNFDSVEFVECKHALWGEILKRLAPSSNGVESETNSVADSTGEKAGTHGASKETGDHSRSGLTPVSTFSQGDIARCLDTIENACNFASDAGPLKNCGEWKYLKRLLSASPQPAPDAMREALKAARPHIGDWLDSISRARLLEQVDAALSAPVLSPDEMRGTLETARQEIVLAIAFLGRDVGTERMIRTVEGVITRLARADAAIRSALSPLGAGAAEPVAWRWRHKDSSTWHLSLYKEKGSKTIIVEPLYALPDAPPVRGDRETIARAIFKNRQHLSDEDVGKWFKIYADNPEGVDHFRMAIWRAYSDADAILSLTSAPVSDAATRDALLKYLDIFLHPNPKVDLSGLVCKHGLAIEACPSRDCNNPMAYETAIKRARDYIAAAPVSGRDVVIEALTALLPDHARWREDGDGVLTITVRKSDLRNARAALSAPDEHPESNAEIANRMQQTFAVCGDRWFKTAADRLRASSSVAWPPYIELPLTFWYKNHRGEKALRTVFPISVRFGTTAWYSEAQWLLRAFDRDKQAEREFAMRDIGPDAAPAG